MQYVILDLISGFYSMGLEEKEPLCLVHCSAPLDPQLCTQAVNGPHRPTTLATAQAGNVPLLCPHGPTALHTGCQWSNALPTWTHSSTHRLSMAQCSAHKVRGPQLCRQPLPTGTMPHIHITFYITHQHG